MTPLHCWSMSASRLTRVCQLGKLTEKILATSNREALVIAIGVGARMSQSIVNIIRRTCAKDMRKRKHLYMQDICIQPLSIGNRSSDSGTPWFVSHPSEEAKAAVHRKVHAILFFRTWHLAALPSGEPRVYAKLKSHLHVGWGCGVGSAGPCGVRKCTGSGFGHVVEQFAGDGIYRLCPIVRHDEINQLKFQSLALASH